MKKIILFISLSVMFAGCLSIRQTTLEFIACRVPAGEKITLESDFWRMVPAYELGALETYIKRFPVNVQFAWDDEALYFRFDAIDDDILDEAPENLKNGLYLYGDTLELFLRPWNSRGYWEFHFSASGKFGAIHFPSRGRRMPSNVAYLPMPGLEFQNKVIGTLNDPGDKDERWLGLARIPFTGITDLKPGEPLFIQVTSVAYSIYADWNEKSQLTYMRNSVADPHYLPDWGQLIFKK